MVVTRKSTNPNAPPAPSRTNSSTSTPKAAKKASVKGPSHLKEGHLAAASVENKPVAPPMPKPYIPAAHPEDDGPFGQNPTFLPSPPKKDKAPLKRHAKKAKPRDKSLKGRKRGRQSLSTLEVLLRIFFLLLAIYSVLVCPRDTKNESAVCHNLSVARERIFDPYILSPIQFIANHPAVAPHIAHAKPHIERAYEIVSTQYDMLYKKVEVTTRPYVVQLQREYNLRLRPQVRIMRYNWRKYRRQAQPYMTQAYAAGFRLWTRVEPHVAPLLAKIAEAPGLASFYVVRPLEEAKQKWVDPQLRKIVEKVEEMNASVVSEEASTVASAVEDTTTSTTDSKGNRQASTTRMGHTSTDPQGGFVAPPEPPMDPTNSHNPGVKKTDPSLSETPDNSDAELEAFLTELLEKEETVLVPVVAPQNTGPTPEELAEQARLKKEETARKRADLEARHTKWEEKLKKAGELAKKELVESLVGCRESALRDANNEDGLVQTTIADLKKEALKANKHVQLYFEELQKDKKGDEEKFKDWTKVLEKVDEKFNEKIKDAQEKLQKWVLGWADVELSLIENFAERLTTIADDAQADLGMDYSWLDDVSTHDWTRYHELIGEVRRWEAMFHDLQSGVDLDAPANLVNPRLNEIQTDIRARVDEFFKDNGELRLKALEMWQPRKEAYTPEVPEVSILPIDVVEPPVMVGGVPVDQIVVGRGKEEVEEAFARAEEVKAHNEL